MRQVVAERAGGPEVLRVVDAPVPEPGPGEVLIAAEAVGVNFADVWARLGVEGEPPYRPGIELAGTVAAVGPDVTAPAVGDRVAATPYATSAAYAELVRAPADLCFPLPAGMPATTGAALPPVTGAVDPHDLGQHMCVGHVRLRSRSGVPLPVPGHRQRVDREHLVAGRDQRGHPRTLSVSMPTLTRSRTCSGSRSSPMNSNPISCSVCFAWRSVEEDSRRSNGQVLTKTSGHVIPAAVVASSRPAGAPSAARPPSDQIRGVLTRWPLPEPDCRSRLAEAISSGRIECPQA